MLLVILSMEGHFGNASLSSTSVTDDTVPTTSERPEPFFRLERPSEIALWHALNLRHPYEDVEPLLELHSLQQRKEKLMNDFTSGRRELPTTPGRKAIFKGSLLAKRLFVLLEVLTDHNWLCFTRSD